MAAMNGVPESYYQKFSGTSSTGYIVNQITDSANEEPGLKNEDSCCEAPHSSGLDSAGRSKNREKYSFSNTEHEEKAKCRTNKIPDCKLRLNSPSERKSRSHSRGRSHRRSRSSSGSSSSRSRSRTYYSLSRSSSRSGSHSKRHKQRCRRSSRSSPRSRSRSLGSRYRKHRSRSHRRHQRSPRRYRSRSRSRSPVRAYYGRYRSRSRSRSRGKRYYGFVRRPYPATFRSWRSRSRTRSISRSRSRSPLRLTEKDRRELLEIAKANAAKALGKSVELPPSLKKDSWLSDTLNKSFEGDSGKLTKQSRNLNSTVSTEASTKQAANLFSTNGAVINPVLNKQDTNLAISQKKEESKKAQGQWVPIQCQRSLNRLR